MLLEPLKKKKVVNGDMTRFEFKLKVNFIDEETGEEIYHKVLIDNSNGNEIGFDDMVGLLNEQEVEIDDLNQKNEQLRKIGVMYQGHNPCSNCTYCVEDKLCCGINPPILCDEMKKDYFVYGLCKKHKQIQKSFRRYDDE